MGYGKIVLIFISLIAIFYIVNKFLIKNFKISSSSRFLIIGHRGASGYEPENTLSSFKRALEMGVDMIELDVHVCKTGELIVMHDQDVDRTTNGHGNIAEMSFDQLQELTIQDAEKIPTLSEVIDLVNRQVPINIELKGLGAAKAVADLLKTYVVKGWSYHDFIVSSFNTLELFEFKKVCPGIKIGVLFVSCDDLHDIIKIAQELKAEFIGLDIVCVNRAIVTKIHEAGLLVFVWTVNHKKTADQMRAIWVDGIFSNVPDRVQ